MAGIHLAILFFAGDSKHLILKLTLGSLIQFVSGKHENATGRLSPILQTVVKIRKSIFCIPRDGVDFRDQSASKTSYFICVPVSWFQQDQLLLLQRDLKLID